MRVKTILLHKSTINDFLTKLHISFVENKDLWIFIIVCSIIALVSLQIQLSIKLSLIILTLCILLWMSELIPIGITGLIPLILAPIFGLAKFEDIVGNYSSRIIFLLISGFILASSITKWGIDKKISYFIIRLLGRNPKVVILSLIITTALLSMIMPNTTAAALMIPVGLGILNSTRGESKEYKISLLLSIAYAASIGGIALLIGTPPNLIATDYLSKENINMSFFTWSKIMLPFSIIFIIILWLYITFKSKLPKNITLNYTRTKLKDGAKITIIVVLSAVILWFTKSFVFEKIGLFLDDVFIGLAASILLFVIRIKGEPLLKWEDANIPWDIILMFGGGLALGSILLSSGTAQWTVSALNFLPKNEFIFLIVTSMFIVFATELLSNTVLAATIMPVIIELYKTNGFSPLAGILTVAVCSTMAFMFPIGTPPNAIVFKSRIVSFKKMIEYGFVLNLLVVVLWVVYLKFFLKL